MNNIEWKEGAVCYADGEQLFQFSWSNKLDLVDINLYKVAIKSVASIIDFQLNEPRQGDYIQKSELDTERKYNDAVEVFGLFDISVHGKGFNYLKPANTLLIIDSDWEFIGTSEDDSDLERKITYNQLMAIGKLKRLMNERDKVNDSEKPNSCNKPKLATQYLNECIEVQKQRGEQYDSTGTGERSFAAAASAFNALTGKNIKGSDVCLLLTCVKAVRQYSNPNRLHDDSLLDGVSYLSLWAGELNKELK